MTKLAEEMRKYYASKESTNMTSRLRTLFSYKPDPMPSFYRDTYFKIKNPKFEPFLRASEFFGASEAGKEKQPQQQSNKIRTNFLMR